MRQSATWIPCLRCCWRLSIDPLLCHSDNNDHHQQYDRAIGIRLSNPTRSQLEL